MKVSKFFVLPRGSFTPLAYILEFFVLILFFSFCWPSGAQESPRVVQGPNDRDIPTPAESGQAAGHIDDKAIQELQAYSLAVGGGGNGIRFTARAKLTYAANPDEVLDATLWIAPQNMARIDVAKSSGHDILIYNGKHGSVTYATGKKQLLFAESAAAGFAPFDLPLSALSAPQRYSIIDKGLITCDNTVLHRVSLEIPLPAHEMTSGAKGRQAVIDFYFDPSSHMLMKSASMIAINGSSKLQLFRVTKYASYRRSGGISIPTDISESVNGQAIWAMNISEIDTTSESPSKNFLF